MFNAPIPGESLTREPKNAAYEQPPELNDPEDALIYYIDKLTDENRMGSIILLLENGLDVRTITEGVLRKGVFEGIHTIDVSLMIAPAVHEYIKTTADMVGIEYEEGFETGERDKKLSYQINETRARKALAKAKADPREAVEAVEDFKEDPVSIPEPKGLMSRRAM